MLIEDLELGAGLCCNPVPLTPPMMNVDPSIVGYPSFDGRYGMIAASEAPSGMRQITSSALMGYNSDLFEWVLGPSEAFVSEPVFYFGFAGEVRRTISGQSTPLDRAVEGPLQRFLDRHVVLPASSLPSVAPQWITWEASATK